MVSQRCNAAIIGTGNIGTDLLMKTLRRGGRVHCAAFVGVDPASDGLRRAAALGVDVFAEGLQGLMRTPAWENIALVFDATSAKAHVEHDAMLRGSGRRLIDLTPAAIGPYVVPVVNLDEHLDAPNVNLVTCGGQATLPILYAISRVQPVQSGEIVASIASKSAGPGTRANIDEFTRTTGRALEQVCGVEEGKAIIILNPADPPLLMRDTVHAFLPDAPTGCEPDIEHAVRAMVAQVARYVPGYRLAQRPYFLWHRDPPLRRPGKPPAVGLQVSVFLEVEGSGDYLPPYAGNLDIMTAAALAVGERLASHLAGEEPT